MEGLNVECRGWKLSEQGGLSSFVIWHQGSQFNRKRNGKSDSAAQSQSTGEVRDEEKNPRRDVVSTECLQHFNYNTDSCWWMTIDLFDCLYEIYRIIINVFSWDKALNWTLGFNRNTTSQLNLPNRHRCWYKLTWMSIIWIKSLSWKTRVTVEVTKKKKKSSLIESWIFLVTAQHVFESAH